jgi:hypothetical protein
MDLYDQHVLAAPWDDLDLWKQSGLDRIRYQIRDVPLEVEGMLDPHNSLVVVFDTKDQPSAG